MEFFVLIVAVISVVLSIITLKYSFNGDINYANICLSGFLFTMGLYGIAHHIINYSNNLIAIACVLNIFTPLFIAIGPFLYLFTKKTITDKVNEFTYKDFLCIIIPVTFIFIDLFPHLTSSFDKKVEIANNLLNDIQKYKGTKHFLLSDINSTLLRQLTNLVFITLSILNIFKIESVNSIFKNQSKIILRFIYYLNISNLLFTFLMIIYLISLKTLNFITISENASQIIYNLSWLSHNIIIMIILFYPSVLYNLPQALNYETKDNFKEIDKKTYKQYTLNNDYTNNIKDKINYFLENKKEGEDFKLSTLTFETKIPTHHLNLYFKEELKISFTNWKNKHKLKYALKLIEEGSLNNFTIEAIAMKSGFQTYSNFYNLFKEETKKTPSGYIQSIKIYKKE
jgi:AraC-like DNA-binding protein